MSWIKRMAGALMITGALLNLAPMASAAETDTAEHCFIIDNAVVCLVICTVQNLSVKPCADVSCTDDLPTVCFVVGEVWDLLP